MRKVKAFQICLPGMIEKFFLRCLKRPKSHGKRHDRKNRLTLPQRETLFCCYYNPRRFCMKVLNLKKLNRGNYLAKKDECLTLPLPALKYLCVDGIGDPNGSDFSEAVQALYGVAYSIKFAYKKKKGGACEYPVMPLEGLWDAKDFSVYEKNIRQDWKWTLLILQPDFVKAKDLSDAKKVLKSKRENPVIDKVELRKIREGLSCQTLHVGPYKNEMETVAFLHKQIEAKGLVFNGLHHEIYLSDPRRCAPEKMRTIIRYPVKNK